MERAKKKPDYGGRLIRHFGRPGGKSNYVQCEFLMRDDANTVADELAEFIFKEAELIEYEPATSDSPWGKVFRGILNPMSQERKIFVKNLKNHIDEVWIGGMGKKPTLEIPEDVDEEAIAEAKEKLRLHRLANQPPRYLHGTQAHMTKRNEP